jgi:ribosomal protein L40E
MKSKKLRSCVDCDNQLSPTAQVCGKCNSTDPFGIKRADEKFKVIMLTIAILVFLSFFGAWKWTGITPVEVLKGDFHKITQ